MFRRIRRWLWIAFWLLMTPDIIRIAWLLIHDRQARIGAFVLLCAAGGVFATTFLVRPTRAVYRYDCPTRPDWP